MPLTLQPLGPFAYEVVGLQLWQELDQAVIDELDALWSQRGVLVFRRQALSERELINFSQRFGRLEHVVRRDWASAQQPAITRISNMRNEAGDLIGGLGSNELAWHSDQSYMADPATGSVLYMVEMPGVGGHTYWANLQLAYEALSDEVKAQIDDLHGVFSYSKRQAGYKEAKPLTDDIKQQTPGVIHPLVNRHPLSGQKSLYLDPSTTIGIDGMPEDEGQALLDSLNSHATQAPFVYRHEWQIGDLVMWDNGFLLHRRDPFDAAQNRLLKRTTINLSPARHIVPTSMLATTPQ